MGILSKNGYALPAVIVLSCVYFLLFIPPNLTGAKDAHMLAAFRLELPEYGTDEFAHFRQITNMTKLGATPYETLRNFVFYNNFFYGYPFFLTSALAILPLRLIEQLSKIEIPTTIYAVILRQLSVLFMLLAIGVLVYAWTGYRSVAKSVLLFAFLAATPAVFLNNMFWHPDSLVTLFMVLTIFFLSRDDLRFGIWFVLAAVSCGLATGTKLVGIFFFLSVAVYLVLGAVHRRLEFRQVLKFGAVFAGVMALSIIVVNPLLLIPGVAKQYVNALSGLAALNSWGWDVERPRGPSLWYTEALRENFGFWWIYAIALSLCVLGLFRDRQKKLLSIIILTWMFPLSAYMLFSFGYKGSRYFIPVLLPVLSCIGNMLDDESIKWARRHKAALCMGVVSILLCVIQFAHYVSTDTEMYGSVLHREDRSAALKFYRQLQDTFISSLPPEQHLTIVREAALYLPPSRNWVDFATYGTIDYDYIDRTMPDLILLRTESVDGGSDIAMIDKISPMLREQWMKSYSFFADAKMGSLRGFRQLLRTSFGVAFVRSSSR